MVRHYLAAVAVTLLLLGCWSYRQAVDPPVLRTAYYAPARWPAGAAPVRVLFLADIHLSDPDMPPARFRRVVDRINTLRPDCVLIGGDYTSDKWGDREFPVAPAIAELARLRPRIATIAVIGNHDRWPDGATVSAGFRKAGVTLISNQAARCGPLGVGGTFALWDYRSHVTPALAALRESGGAPILMSHAPDLFPYADGVGLMLAGHTHCGQIRLPGRGPLSAASDVERRYGCGVSRAFGRFLITTAGIGTSIAPLRWNAPADMWLITIGPRRGDG